MQAREGELRGEVNEALVKMRAYARDMEVSLSVIVPPGVYTL